MRYIRLKNGIYKVHETESKSLRVKVAYWSKDGIVSLIRKEEIVNQADTIEELCDKFVMHTVVGIWIRKSIVNTRETIANYKRANRSFIKELYGAIWTDKGLIYVAKMNDEGEFELL